MKRKRATSRRSPLARATLSFQHQRRQRSAACPSRSSSFAAPANRGGLVFGPFLDLLDARARCAPRRLLVDHRRARRFEEVALAPWLALAAASAADAAPVAGSCSAAHSWLKRRTGCSPAASTITGRRHAGSSRWCLLIYASGLLRV
jgi:hypothetical protein